MRESIKWIISIEKMASDFYMRAAGVFRNDAALSGFLEHLAQEEMSHASMLREAAQRIIDGAEQMPSITLDEEIKAQVETPFKDHQEMLVAGTLTREALIDCLIKTELSEWNDIFVYFVKYLGTGGRDTTKVAAEIERHKKHIVSYLEAMPEARQSLESIRQLPSVWKERILIVDDSDLVIDLLKAVFAYHAVVETASNGKEALLLVTEKFYDAIVSDVHMPVMDGKEFYRQAVKIDSAIGRRFLFFTSDFSEETDSFFQKERLPRLFKPAPLNEIKNAVMDLVRGGLHEMPGSPRNS